MWDDSESRITFVACSQRKRNLKCSTCPNIWIHQSMVRQTELAIICTSAGVVIGILLSTVVFFCLRWCKKRSDIGDRVIANHRIQQNGHGLGLDSIASPSESAIVPLPDVAVKSSSPLWLNHHNKDRTSSVSGTPKYSYK